MSAGQASAAAQRHIDDLRRAMRDFSSTQAGPTPEAPEPADPSSSTVADRLAAAADYSDLPPQILLPAQFAHHSPHRRG